MAAVHPPGPVGFRPDVDGLRAIAVGSVLAFHAGVPGVPGGFAGVDIFFVLSGFLITSQLLRELGASGRVGLVRFYARRVRRLLPAATLVLLATAALSWLLLPAAHLPPIARDIAASAGYVINWRLAGRSVETLLSEPGPSPVQHLWSLAVEEQFYLVWPLVLLGVHLAVRAVGASPRAGTLVVLALIALPSLAYSVVATAASPTFAYFATTTRVWELALGAAVACSAGRWSRMGARAGLGLTAGGLLAVLAAVALLDGDTAWPGAAALVPTLGAAAVVAGGLASPGSPVARVLGRRPFLWVGRLSYSLYLWHWPLMTIARSRWSEVPWAGAAAVLVSLPVAWLSYRLVEDPLRSHPALARPGAALLLGAGLTAAGLCAAVTLALAG